MISFLIYISVIVVFFSIIGIGIASGEIQYTSEFRHKFGGKDCILTNGRWIGWQSEMIMHRKVIDHNGMTTHNVWLNK